MKKLLSLLVAAVLLPVAANADVLNNVKLIGEVQTIASDMKRDMNGYYNSGTQARVLAGISFNAVENVTANLLFWYGYGWGDNNYTNNGFDNAKGMKLVNANLVFADLFNALEVTVGRQFYGEDGSVVMYLGPSHYNVESINSLDTLDAVTVRYNNDFVALTLLAGRLDDTTQGAISEAWSGIKVGTPADVYGGDLKLKLTDALTAQLYGYDFTNNKYYYQNFVYPENGHSHNGVYGAKLSYTVDDWRLSAEYDRDFFGRHLIHEPKGTPYLVKADIATDIKAVTMRGTFVYTKRNFFGYGNYAPGIMYGDKASARWNSIKFYERMFNIGFDYKPTEKWTVSLDGFSFQDRFGRHRATYEADLTAKYAYNEYVDVFGGIAYAKNGYALLSEVRKYTENYKGQLGVLVKF